MKRIAFMFMLCVVSMLAVAQSNALIVHQKSGKKVYYAFSESPKVTYERSNLVLTTSKVSVEYPLSDLAKFTFGDIADDIRELTVNSDRMESSAVYNMAGHLVKTYKAGESVSTNNLPAGVYIVKSESSTYKILKK